MKEKRRDSKGRILHTGESQRTDGKYLYKYVDALGNTKYVYAWRLTPTDPTPKGKREKPSLRELEQQIRRDIEDGIDSTGKKMTLCQLYAKQNAQRANVKKSTQKQREQLMHYDDVLILLKTGLRISELCGLTVADIDFKNEVVIIDHQLLKSKEQGYYIETPKTKNGTRQVPLSRETIQAFQRVMKKRPKAEPFVIDGRSNFLFVNHKGKPKVAIDYNALFVRMVKKYNKHHKDNPLPHITPHTLRHTFCTRLASKNMNPKDLQYIMGHSNISITMNWYAHASIDTAKSEVQRLIA